MKRLIIRDIASCSLLLVLLAFVGWSCKSQSFISNGYEKDATVQFDADLLSRRVFYLLYELERTPKLQKIISKDKVLHQIFLSKKENLQKAILNCTDMNCMAEAVVLSEDEKDKVMTQLGRMYHNNNQIFSDFVKNTVRPSHAYEFYTNYSDSALLMEAWKEQINGLNYIYKAYLQNKGLIYPKIDSVRFDVRSKDYLGAVKQIVQNTMEAEKSNMSFQLYQNIAIAILQINGRDEAIRFQPLSKVNGKAYDYIPTVEWGNYAYSGILVLGIGPKNDTIALSEGGKSNCRMGAKLYRDKKAPLIVVSGGHVHPYRTPFCEAEQMKKYLIDSLGIPEKVIIMEPHARHTTTNIRNTNRIFLSRGVPRRLPIMVVSNKKHVDYIMSARFTEVYLRDIGFVTHSGLSRLSETTVSYYPTMSSFQINAAEPLDP